MHMAVMYLAKIKRTDIFQIEARVSAQTLQTSHISSTRARLTKIEHLNGLHCPHTYTYLVETSATEIPKPSVWP